MRLDGTFELADAKARPQPAHNVGIWVGAYKPRMLELTGTPADGCLPSIEYLPLGR